MVPSSIQRIEPFPGHMLTLLNEIPLPHRDLPHLVALFEHEPRLLSAATQVATASGRCTVGETLDVEGMLERIGSIELLEIAITLLVRGYMQRAFLVAEDRRYWRYTLACAVSCSEIAAPGGDRLIAYVAGLLHDIGRLALIAAYPEKYANLLALTDRMFQEDQPFDLLEYERLLFGLDHFSTGSWLASTWQLPSWLRAITGKFNDQASAEHRELVATVRAGTRLAHSLGFGYLEAAPRAGIREVLNRLPAAWEHWQTLDSWKTGEEYMRGKIESQLSWYAIPAEFENE
jgi:HD-like signal output (HDOD) protein